jgi:hypothetical protein
MAIFEIQGSDGKTYEVDAPDQNSALNAYRSFSSGQGGSQSFENDGTVGPTNWRKEVIGHDGSVNADNVMRTFITSAPVVGPLLGRQALRLMRHWIRRLSVAMSFPAILGASAMKTHSPARKARTRLSVGSILMFKPEWALPVELLVQHL